MISAAFSDTDKSLIRQRVESLPFRFRRQVNKKAFAMQGKKSAREVIAQVSKHVAYIQRVIAPAKDRLTSCSFAWWALKSKEEARKTARAKAGEVQAAMVKYAELPLVGGEDGYSQKLHYVFSSVVQFIQENHPEIVTPPAETDGQKECALLRMTCAQWWERKLQKIRKRNREYAELAALEVGAKGSPYCSRETVAEFLRDQLAFQAWAKGREMVSELGDTIELQKAIDSGMANPENMRVELMKRIAGLEDYAEEIGAKGAFVTLTAPAKYHRKSGSRHNPAWNGCDPKQTSDYLVNTWKLARAAIDRQEIKWFGVRVAEPHKDGTPHWHLMLWAAPGDLQALKKIIFKYFTQEDSAELWARWHGRHLRNNGPYCDIKTREVIGRKVFPDFKRACAIYRKRVKAEKAKQKKAQKANKSYTPRHYQKPQLSSLLPWGPRFVWVDIETTPRDKETGIRAKSAAGYIAKYISKNINAAGLANMVDSETGELMAQSMAQLVNKDGVKLVALARAKAWASLWGIRQFQFQGCEPITVYRELRRVREAIEHEQIEKIRQGAESERFLDFIKAIKEVNAQAAAEAAAREEKARRVCVSFDVIPQGNQYGEDAKKVVGVSLAEFVKKTRLIAWEIRRKSAALGREALPWSSGNNCTPQAGGCSPQSVRLRQDRKLTNESALPPPGGAAIAEKTTDYFTQKEKLCPI